MPTKTWEPPPLQADSGSRRRQPASAEPGNFESPGRDDARNHDSAVRERGRVDYEEINTHGSER